MVNTIDMHRDGYIFDGWQIDGKDVSGNTIVNKENANELTAVWTSVDEASLNVTNDAAIIVVVIVASLIVITLIRGRFD